MADISLTVNGQPRTMGIGTTLGELLVELELAPQQVIVEYNGEPLERDRFTHTRLGDGDQIEIAQMVGGG